MATTTIKTQAYGDIVPYEETQTENGLLSTQPTQQTSGTGSPTAQSPTSSPQISVASPTLGTETTGLYPTPSPDVNVANLPPPPQNKPQISVAAPTSSSAAATGVSSDTGTGLQGKGDTASGLLTSGKTGLYQAQAGYKPTEDETVEGRLTGLLNKNSKYQQAAVAGSTAEMAKRGMMNSSMAAEAGQVAAIKSAMPIAQQDAGYMQNRGITGLQGEIQSKLSQQGAAQGSLQSTQEAGQQAGLTQVQGDISSILSKQAAGQQLTQQEQNTLNEYQKASALQAEQGDIAGKLAYLKSEYDSALSKQQSGERITEAEQKTIFEYQRLSALAQEEGDREYTMEVMRQQGATQRTQIESEAQTELAKLNITSEEKQAIGQIMYNSGAAFEAQIQQILALKDITNSERQSMIDTVAFQYYNTVYSAMLPYGVTIHWEDLIYPEYPEPH